MRNFLFILMAVFAFPSFCFSQSEAKITPVHLLKFDVFKSTFSQLHVDYERYNGKKGAVDVGFSLFYRNPGFASVNQGMIKNANPNLYAFQYSGYGVELRRKFYFPKSRFNPYIAPEVTYKYKHFNNRDILIYGERDSSDAEWNTVSRQMHVLSLNAIVGFTTNLHKTLVLDINAGAGIGYADVDTQVSDYGRYHSDDNLAGHDVYTVLQLQLSAKICFGIQGKTKN